MPSTFQLFVAGVANVLWYLWSSHIWLVVLLEPLARQVVSTHRINRLAREVDIVAAFLEGDPRVSALLEGVFEHWPWILWCLLFFIMSVAPSR